MAVHWQVQFKSISGTDYVVNIYDSTYSGTPVQLIGAAEPFVTSENDNNDILEPVRYSTGYINIVNTDGLSGLMPTTPKARFVTLTSGNETLWQGYIKQQQFSQPWDTEPYVLQFPIISAIGILDRKIEKGDVPERARIAEYLRLAFTNTDATYDTIIFPADLSASNGAIYDVIFRLGLQDRNWFNFRNENVLDPDESRYDGMTWLNILTELMKAFGYTLYEKGKTIFIIGHRNDNYLSIPFSALSTLALNGSVTETAVAVRTIQVNNLQIAGNDGTVDYLESKRRAVVEAQINPFQMDSLPILNTLYLYYLATLDVVKNQNGHGTTYAYYNKRLGLYGPQQGTNIWTFKSYQNDVEQTWSGQDITRDYYIAVYCRDESGNDMIVINYDSTENAVGWGTGWVCSVKSPSESFFAGGYITLHANVNFYEGTGGSVDSTHRCKFMLRVGSYYYNASTHSWTTTPTQFTTSLQDGQPVMSNQEQGEDGSLYFKIPANGIYGDVELYIYAPYSTSPQATFHQAVYEISTLDMRYVDYIDDPFKDEQVTDTNRFVVGLNTFASQDEEQNIAITSFIQQRMGYGVVLAPDFSQPLGKLYDRYVGDLIYFEDTLTRIIKKCYQNMQEVLTIPVRRVDEFLPTDIYSNNGSYRYLSLNHNWADEKQTIMIYKRS